MTRLTLVLCLLIVPPVCSRARAEAQEPKEPATKGEKGLKFFEDKIRPLLVEHCYQCHGPKKQESNLRLDSWAAIEEGGDTGESLISEEVDQSLLLAVVEYELDDLQMPPDGKLPEGSIEQLRRWIKMGAPYPDKDKRGGGVKPRVVDLSKGREFWAFRPLVDAPLPKVGDADWPSTSIDYYILAQLEARGLSPAPPATRRELVRRVTFDLLGVPPSPEETRRFLDDPRPDAFARLVDRLLASPRYGERWGRHWLDVARYADSNGLDENIAHGNAWRYRDYVIEAFNRDKPFDRFVREQLAGDRLPATTEAQRHEQLIATGFLSLGPKVLAEGDLKKLEMDIIDEQIDTTGRAFLGLTFGCARCHDHKFDPILTADYYALAGFFKSTQTMENFKRIARWYEHSLVTREDLESQRAHQERVVREQAKIDRIIAQANQQVAGPDGKLPKKPEDQYPKATQDELKKLRAELTALKAAAPETPTAMGVTDGDSKDVHVHIRGSHLSLGRLVPRRFPLVLAGEDQPKRGDGTSGRLALAQWLVSADNPLTSRVAANRIWRWHFGVGLCSTTDNFGRLGERPTHGELLDWLALRLRRDDWSIKRLHRVILLSRAYRMSSRFDADAARKDPENRWLWRFRVRRLEAEAIRDSLLAVSETLDSSMGGSMLHVKNRQFFFDHTSKDTTKYDSRRRSVYLPVVRNHLYDVFSLFDYSDASVTNGDRGSSTVAPQALFMMNSELVNESAQELARGLIRDHAEGSARVEALFERLYARRPSSDETERMLAFAAAVSETIPPSDAREQQAWALVSQIGLQANEFLYIK